ncbi:hypothetical protein [Enterovirga sp. CN4-39]|uniref:hypothetical protein n=1 Tax=Enterovirga sp. CN4-39 TaxID=3400910 RepID=UPI003C06CF75
MLDDINSGTFYAERKTGDLQWTDTTEYWRTKLEREIADVGRLIQALEARASAEA